LTELTILIPVGSAAAHETIRGHKSPLHRVNGQGHDPRSMALSKSQNTCSVRGCENDHEARGMCHTHYSYWRRQPENRDLVAKPRPTSERLEEQIERRTDGCWIWLGSNNGQGYGTISIGGKRKMAHRAVYEDRVGEIPEGLHLDHLCRNPPCVNPDHLEPVSSWENVKRGNSSPPVENAAKTHCVHGHEFTPENTYVRPNGSRSCRTCLRHRARTYYRKSRG
jgi:hypothetical protein